MIKILRNISLIFGIFVFTLSLAFAEDITITTYYPSPHGSYNSLQTDKLGVGDNNNSGGLLTSADVPTTSGDAWIAGRLGIANGANDPTTLLDLGLAGTTGGSMKLAGSSSGNITINTAAAAGTWTWTLPTDDGNSGQQLATNGSGVTSWAAANSSREMKDIIGTAISEEALAEIIKAKVYRFHYKPKMGTGDSDTEYVGLMADEAPWAMHYNCSIVNPVNTLGYMVLGIQALYHRLLVLTQAVKVIRLDQKKEIQKQQDINRALQGQIDMLKSRLEELESKQAR